MCEQQVVPALQKKWCDTRDKKRTLGPHTGDHTRCTSWLCQTWFPRGGSEDGEATKDMESSSGTQRRTDSDRLRAILLLSALKSWWAYKKILRTRSKSGNFVLLGEKICIMVVLYTQTPTHSICTPRQPGGKAFLHTIYGCLPPAYTHSQWFYSGPGCSCCQVTLSTPPGRQLNANCRTLVPWQVLGTNLQLYTFPGWLIFHLY